jgi:GTP-binding protein
LLNSILGYQRVIVSPIPHTTREPQDTKITYKDQEIKIIDTAGISKRGHRAVGLQKFGIQKTLSAVRKSDLVLLVLDISEEITHQDAKLVEEIFEAKKSMIIVANKWDKIEERDTKKFTRHVYSYLPFAQFAPIQFTSALTGEKTKKILDLCLAITANRLKEISDSQLDKLLNKIVKIHLPTKGKGSKYPHVYDIRQIGVNPPYFHLRVGRLDDLHHSYVRFVENRLTEKYGFVGTPIRIKVIKKNRESLEDQAAKAKDKK